MTVSEETLMAFADGEVDDSTRAAVERAICEDPQVSQRVEYHRALRRRLQTGFAQELSEPVPDRLMALLREARSAASAAQQDRDQRPRGRQIWRAAWSMAAGVVLGLALGYGAWRQGGLPIGRGAAGTLIAQGVLDDALSRRLTGEPGAAGPVRVGLSYLTKSGEYCRTFSLSIAPASGIACRHDGQWQIQALTQDSEVRGADYRPAATTLSPIILKLVEDEIQGEPLDAAGESAAREHRWQSPK